MNWRPASDFTPKQGDTYLVAFDDGYAGVAEFWCFAVGSLYPSSEGRFAVWPSTGGAGSYCVAWEDVSYAIPFGDLLPKGIATRTA